MGLRTVQAKMVFYTFPATGVVLGSDLYYFSCPVKVTTCKVRACL